MRMRTRGEGSIGCPGPDRPAIRRTIEAVTLDQQAREFCLRNLERGVAAAGRQPAGTLMLRSGKLSPAELADQILARLGD